MKILLVNEASMFNSGLGKYGKNLLLKLRERGYKVAELGFGCGVNPPNDGDIPWRTYYNEIAQDDPRKQSYDMDGDNKFGKWRFDKVVLDWRPECVLCILDPWNTNYIAKSPTRHLFNYIFMPTFDSFPIKSKWMSSINNADLLLSYSDWAVKECKSPIFATPRYGVNPNEFYPINDKAAHKTRFGINSKDKIIGCIMKNQPRKKFGDLFECFSLIAAKKPNVKLYIHTAWPEQNPWNIPRLLLQYGIQDKVYLTYYCTSCESFYPSLYQGDYTHCKHCFKKTAYIKNSAYSINDKSFNDIYNLFDIYLQYSNSEGAGMPVAEAAYCGLPTFVVDYTAMEDYKTTIDSIPLPPLTAFWDQYQEAFRAVIDNVKSAQIICDFLDKSDTDIIDYGLASMKKAHVLYNWDKVVDIWESAIKHLPSKRKEWESGPKYLTNKLPNTASDLDIMFFMKKYMKIKDPISLLNTHSAIVNQGSINKYILQHPIQVIIKDLNNWVDYYNKCENIRIGKEILPMEDYIEYAHIKEKVHEDSNIS